MAKSKVVICPYCGETQPAAERCRVCAGLFEPLSRQATHNAMGPWFVRDPQRPFQPGCSYETLVKLIRAGRVTKYSIIRGPTTRQYWTVAKHVPGVAHVLGYCHQCDTAVDPDAVGCPNCGTPFGAYLDRNYLGLPDIRPLPGEASFENDESPATASVSVGTRYRRPAPMPSGGTLSRFATDEELFAPSVGPSAPASPDPMDEIRESEQDAPMPAVPDSSVQSYAAAAARRSLERRLHKEQRLVRILMVVVFLSIALTVLGNISAIRNWFNGTGGANNGENRTNTPAPVNRNDGAKPDSGDSTAAEPGQMPESPNNGADDGANGADNGSTESNGADESMENAGNDLANIVDPIEMKLQEALDLATRAKQSDRPAADRRADLERAIAMVSNIPQGDLSEAQRTRIAGVLAGLREDVERLALREFFPG